MGLSRLNGNTTVQKDATGCLRHQFSRGIWDKVSCLITTYTKASGYKSHQRVIVKLYGNLPAERCEKWVTACHLKRPVCIARSLWLRVLRESHTTTNDWRRNQGID